MVDKNKKNYINNLNFKKKKQLILKTKGSIDPIYKNMVTFKDLYEFLQLYEENNILT